MHSARTFLKVLPISIVVMDGDYDLERENGLGWAELTFSFLNLIFLIYYIICLEIEFSNINISTFLLKSFIRFLNLIFILYNPNY